MMTGSTIVDFLFSLMRAAVFVMSATGGTGISAFDYYANLIASLGDNDGDFIFSLSSKLSNIQNHIK